MKSSFLILIPPGPLLFEQMQLQLSLHRTFRVRFLDLLENVDC